MKRVLFIILTLLPLVSSAQRVVINLNDGWNFTPGSSNITLSNTQSQRVNLPHTWNLDALNGNANYQRQMGNYVRQFSLPKEWQNQREVYLKFKGANQTAEVYVNGKRVGRHSGGYTAFGFNITPMLRYDAYNTLSVRVSNAQNLDVMPIIGEFNIYGGLYRGVELISTPKIHFSHTKNSTNGVKVVSYKINKDRARLNILTTLEGGVGQFAHLTLKIKDADGEVLQKSNQRVKISPSGVSEVEWWTDIDMPRLWNGTIAPYLYTLEAIVSPDHSGRELKESDKMVSQRDSISQSFGVRYFEVDKNNQFLLNGEPYELRGVTRHEDRAMVGNALRAVDHQDDMALIKEVGANAVRLTNYPQDSYFLDLCDREGIIVWSEIPFIGPGRFRDSGYNESMEFHENGITQLTEMIMQQYNHPSVIFWGLFNELSQRGSDPVNYVKELNKYAKELDPLRLTVAASNQDGELNFITDLIGFNQNIGWDGAGVPADIDAWTAALRRDFPDLKVALSQYGASGDFYEHQDTLKKPDVNGGWYPQEWQCYYHEEYLRSIKSKDSFWGTFVESMFDFGDAFLPGGVNKSGMVTFDRARRKDLFYLYKANWNSKDMFVHITGKGRNVRHNLTEDIKVYSNCQSVGLRVNGELVKELLEDGSGVFIFKGCKFRDGYNSVEAFSSWDIIDRISFEVDKELLEI